MDSRSFTLPKGEYFFGDLGYLFPHPNYPTVLNTEWMEIFCANEEGDWHYKDKDYLLFNTGGDGYFFNHRGKEEEIDEVPVDSGTLGLIPTDDLNQNELKEVIEAENGLIYFSDTDITVDIQGEGSSTYGIHIYPKKEKYYLNDQAILIVIDKNEYDEDYFTEKCPPFTDEEDDEAYYALQVISNDPDIAIEKYDKLIEEDPNNPDHYFSRGVEYNSQGEYYSAIDDYNRVIKIDPNYESIHYYIGLAKRYLGDHKSAIESYTKGIEFDENNSDLFLKRGMAKIELEQYQAAIEDCNKAVELSPEYADPYFNRGLAKSSLEDYQGAIKDYTKTIEVDPDDTWENTSKAYLMRGISKENLDDQKGAYEDYKKSAELGNEDAAKLVEEKC